MGSLLDRLGQDHRHPLLKLGPGIIVAGIESRINPLMYPTPADPEPASYVCHGIPIAISCPFNGVTNRPKVYD